MADNDLALHVRDGLPQELGYLLAQYPRRGWYGHANFGEMTRFWLEVHQSFRDVSGDLQARAEAMRDGAIDIDAAWRSDGPLLRHLLRGLGFHHRVEDARFFPVLMNVEKSLTAGFDLLERDHHELHDRIDTLDELARSMSTVLADRDADSRRQTINDYARVLGELAAGLVRHLDDEEDLIVPLLLDRSEIILPL